MHDASLFRWFMSSTPLRNLFSIMIKTMLLAISCNLWHHPSPLKLCCYDNDGSFLRYIAFLVKRHLSLFIRLNMHDSRAENIKVSDPTNRLDTIHSLVIGEEHETMGRKTSYEDHPSLFLVLRWIERFPQDKVGS